MKNMGNAKDIAKRLKVDAEELESILDASEVKAKSASSQTKATAKYQEKVGLVSRSYKLKAVDADIFKAACEANGESQAAVLTRLMAAYVNGDDDSQIKACWFCRLKNFLLRKK
jgi:hypothetical protein